MLKRRIFIPFLMLLVMQPAAAATDTPPRQVIQEASSKITTAIESRKSELRADSAKLYKLVEDIVLPHFDFDFIAKLVLGRAWKNAAPEERTRFTAAFQQLLVRTYSNALLEYSGEQIKWLETQASEDPNRVIQRAEVTLASGQVVPMNYRMHKTAQGWKVYDINIDAISLVMNYRGTFAGEIRKNGLGSLIERLESKNTAS
jgi:phospholipid transport system substrate-binding protein